MSGKIEQGLHEKLCAYVLGELDGADRAEVERELLRSPELREEKARLESTIGAVRDAMQPAQLSDGAKEALDRAVRPAPIAQFPWLRLAAGIGALGLGWWIFARTPATTGELYVESEMRRELPAAPTVPADREVAALENARERDVQAVRGQVELAAASDAKNEVVTKDLVDAIGYRAPETAEKRAAALVVDAPELKKADAGAVAPGAVLLAESSAPAAVELAQADASTRALDSSGVSAPPGEAAGTAIGVGSSGPAAGAAPAPIAGRKLGTGPRKGRPAAPASSTGSAKSAEALPPAAVGSYRGPGDSVPAGGGSGGVALTGSTGPSTPGPIAPSSPAPSGATATSGDDFFIGLGQRGGDAKDQEEALARLTTLGYSGGVDGDDRVRQLMQKRWHELTADEQARRIELRYGTIVEGCSPHPNERPRDMFFRFWGDNPFEVTLLDKQSTFSADVDTASYALARRYLQEGKVPEKAQVRTEEFVNYFASDVEAPRNATFSVHSDLTPSRFSADSARRMLRVVVRAKDVDKAERQPMHLTFVVDVSGSMKENDRLETVKHALRMLVAQLDARDSIALITFSNDARLVLPMTPATDRTKIEAAIAPLAHGGSTNSNAGLQLGYAQALQGLDPNVVNRVVFLSDGVANVGVTDAEQILAGVKSIREQGIFLNTIGVGMNNHNDVLLEQLADKGDGVCNYVDSPKEIQRALVDRFTGAFQPVAKDVKIQVEFDPQQVMRYRLLGYENRAIADADFRNDAVDAGELGAGHQVTALYEIEPTGSAGDDPMATVRLRWKPIRAAGIGGTQEATEASFQVSSKSYQAFEASPPGNRRAVIVAQFAEILRRSIHARGESLDDLITEANRLQAQIPNDAEFTELVGLMLRTKDAIVRTLPACDDLCQTVDALRSNRYLGAVVVETGSDAKTLQEIEESRQKLEHRLRELLRQQAAVDGAPKIESLGYSGSPR